jgi:toxin ParE1/3/4
MNAPWKIRQTPKARNDRTKIIRWTIKQFGSRQAQIYTETIALAMAALHDGPGATGVKQRDDLSPGIRLLHVARNGRKGRHFIVFRVADEHTIDVLRILYDGMDLSSHV